MYEDFTAIDFETANHSRHSACQLGICLVKGKRIVEQHCWLIKPPTTMFTFSGLHGITYGMVKHEPTFAEIWPHIRPYVENRVVIAHNVHFDISVLQSTLSYYGLALPNLHTVDSVKVARKTWPQLPNHRLDTVAEHLQIALQHHNAASDAKVCAEIILRAAGAVAKDYQANERSLG